MPSPVTNAEFTRAVSRAVHRPAVLPAPAFVLRLVLGRMASMLLDSSRVRPAVAENLGYRYDFGNVTDAVDEVAR
jgi:NAD dependent epimerase/dehydratase family enzyme